MWTQICLACIFTFPNPTPADEFEIRKAIADYFHATNPATQPWNETSPPLVSLRLKMLTPQAALANEIQIRPRPVNNEETQQSLDHS
jgi:hypothetical protein